MNNKLLLLFLLVLALIIPVYSQEKDTSDTITDWENWDNNADNKWDNIESHMFDFKIKGAPTIEFNYGGSQMHLKSINNKFTKPGMLELKLGYTTDKSYNGSDYVSKYSFKFFHIRNLKELLSL